jgi:hypothetical protein
MVSPEKPFNAEVKTGRRLNTPDQNRPMLRNYYAARLDGIYNLSDRGTENPEFRLEIAGNEKVETGDR